MKNLFKKMLAALICFICVVGTSVIGDDGSLLGVEAQAAERKVGDIITFGSYPQSRVINSNTLAALDAVKKDWKKVGYYQGDADMQYADIVVDGNKYRAVQFNKYKLNNAWESTDCFDRNEHENIHLYCDQYNNGYRINITYYFKFEPLRWRILDPKAGLILSEYIVDSQAFNKVVYEGEIDDDNEGDQWLWRDEAHTINANDYESSDIREWLNAEFYNTVFTPEERKRVLATSLDNSADSCCGNKENFNHIVATEIDGAPTNDRVFLLSLKEARDVDYGFEDTFFNSGTRLAEGTDYAKAQGLICDGVYGHWRLRTPESYDRNTSGFVKFDGSVDGTWYANSASLGIRPAVRVDDLTNMPSDIKTDKSDVLPAITERATYAAAESQLQYSVGSVIKFGSYPQSEVKDERILKKLTSMELHWQNYNYYLEDDDGRSESGNWMQYVDVYFNREKYRGVQFTKYRSADNEQQENGYEPYKTYFFKYEPIEWIVLDPQSNLLLCKSLIDSQAYSNTMYLNGYEYTSDKAGTNYTCDYESSSIREWLNDDFYNTAFTADQQRYILTTELDNSAYSDYMSIYNSEPTADKIFLMSYSDVQNAKYGFINDTAETPTRQAKGTDYAKSQGLSVGDSYTSTWRLRSAGSCSESGSCVGFSGEVAVDNLGITDVGLGIRPAMRASEIFQISDDLQTALASESTTEANETDGKMIGKWIAIVGIVCVLLVTSVVVIFVETKKRKK